MSTDLKDWFFQIPVVTRFIFVSTFVVSLGAGYGAVSPYSVLLLWPQIIGKFELWRLLTNFLFHKLSISFLMLMTMFFQQSKSLEATEYEGRTSDYIFFLLFNAVLLLPIGWFMNFTVLGRSLIMSIIYMWSRKFPTMTMSFYFGISFEGKYLPWALCAFDLLLGGVPLQYFAGILTAHIFYYITEVMPRVSGKPSFLRTPAFLYRILPPNYNSRVGVQFRQQQHAWGNAHQLR